MLQVLPSLGAGGVEQGTLDIVRALTRERVEAYVATSCGSRLPELEHLGGKLVKLPMASKNPLRFLGSTVIALKNVINELGIDLVHARSRGPAWTAYLACALTKTPFVTTFHGTYNYRNHGKKYYNSSMIRGDRVIAISDFIEKHILDSYRQWVSPNRITRIYRGIDVKAYDQKKITISRKEKLYQQWRLSPSQKVFIMPGRLTRWKGQETALKALSLMNNADAVLVIVGSDQGRHAYRQELLALSLELRLKNRVRIVEHCDDMPAAYSLADCLIHASTDPEAFGRVIAEGQAMGLPCLVSNLGAPKEIIVEGETGWCLPPGDEAQLCNAMETVLNLTKEEKAAIAVKAQNRVRELFSLDQMCDQTLSVYADLLSENR